MRMLYNTLLTPLRVIAPLVAWYRGRSPETAAAWRQRLARELPTMPAGGVWFHGSSVGEALLVGELARGWRRRHPQQPLAVSAYTPSGLARLPAAPEVDARFLLPFDFAGNAERLLDALRPRGLALVETELWPNLLAAAARRGLPVAVVNARLSPRRWRRYTRLRRLYAPLLGGLSAVGAQTAEDARRFVELGAPQARTRVTGNIKYDLPAPSVSRDEVRARLGLADEPLWVAGSTGDGEDPAVLQAFAALRRRVPRLRLALVPRHPPRAAEVAPLLDRSGWRWRRWSDGEPDLRETDLLLVDTIGQLTRLYAAADAAFVGGSLVPIGGHNVLEPAAVGVPVAFGPHVEHFRAPADALLAAGAARSVDDADGLAAALGEWLDDPALRVDAGARGRRVVETHRGALARNLELLADWSAP